MQKAYTLPFDIPIALPRVASEVLFALRDTLPSRLLYHTIGHTEQVIRQAVFLATQEKMGPRDLELLVIAAAFHDSGFLDRMDSNEPLGAKRAQTAMLSSGLYCKDEMTVVGQAINDTALNMARGVIEQKPTTRISPYLLDADLANLGASNFFEQTELVREETGRAADRSYYQEVELLLRGHRWLTKTAQALWQSGKDNNLKALAARIASLP